MTKDELIAYLEAVKAAETAKYFCEKTIGELQEQFRRFPDLPLPATIDNFTFTPPAAKKQPPSQTFDTVELMAKFCVIGTPFLIVLVGNLLLSLPIMALGCIGFILMPFVGKPYTNLLFRTFNALPAVKDMYKKEAAEKAAALAAEEAEVAKARDAAFAVWSKKKAENDAQIAAARQESAARAMVRQLLAREQEYLRKRCENIQMVLDRLYAKEIVYERFHTLPAVTQLLEYLKMGVCTQLEGTNQGYYIYLDDLRTEKIVGSIQQLEQTVARGFNAVLHNQAIILNTLKETNDLVCSMRSTLHHDLIDLRRTVATGALATSASVSHLASRTEALATRTEALTTEWHDYIDRMESSATSYLRGR